MVQRWDTGTYAAITDAGFAETVINLDIEDGTEFSQSNTTGLLFQLGLGTTEILYAWIGQRNQGGDRPSWPERRQATGWSRCALVISAR